MISHHKKLAYSNCFVFVDAIDTNQKELELNCSQLICTSESGEATSTRAVASLNQK